MRIGFIGRTKMLYDTILLFSRHPEFELSFIWVCREEDFYEFESEKFRELAERLGAVFVYSAKIDDDHMLVEADVVVSVNFRTVIPKFFFSRFNHGVINAHTGDLPRYRGNACPNWAILNGETHIALTFHIMDEGLDSGPIIEKRYFELNERTYIGDIYKWLEFAVPSGFLASVRKISSGFLPEAQVGRPLRTFPRIPSDARLNFSRDWLWNYRLIRASSRPLTGAYGYLNGTDEVVTIFAAEPVELDYDFFAISGQILETFQSQKTFLIAISGQAFHVTDFSINGKPSDVSLDVLRGSIRNRLV